MTWTSPSISLLLLRSFQHFWHKKNKAFMHFCPPVDASLLCNLWLSFLSLSLSIFLQLLSPTTISTIIWIIFIIFSQKLPWLDNLSAQSRPKQAWKGEKEITAAWLSTALLTASTCIETVYTNCVDSVDFVLGWNWRVIFWYTTATFSIGNQWSMSRAPSFPTG